MVAEWESCWQAGMPWLRSQVGMHLHGLCILLRTGLDDSTSLGLWFIFALRTAWVTGEQVFVFLYLQTTCRDKLGHDLEDYQDSIK